MVHKQSAIGALLSISSDTAAMTCTAAADEIVSEAPEWATSHLEAAAENQAEMRCVDARCISERVFSQL